MIEDGWEGVRRFRTVVKRAEYVLFDMGSVAGSHDFFYFALVYLCTTSTTDYLSTIHEREEEICAMIQCSSRFGGDIPRKVIVISQ